MTTEPNVAPSAGYTVPAAAGPARPLRPGVVTAAVVVAFATLGPTILGQLGSAVVRFAIGEDLLFTEGVGLLGSIAVSVAMVVQAIRLPHGRKSAQTTMTVLALLCVLSGLAGAASNGSIDGTEEGALVGMYVFFAGLGLLKAALGVALLVLLTRPAVVRYCVAPASGIGVADHR